LQGDSAFTKALEKLQASLKTSAQFLCHNAVKGEDGDRRQSRRAACILYP
jgi:hypothetical protein